MDRRRAAGALLALAACIACSAAAPTASNQTALDLYESTPEGCYYNFQHYGEGDRIMTNEPCLNCTCHNRMLMCYLRVCPFTKAIGQDCTVEKRADQCCPIVTCPDVPVDLLTSTSTTSPAEYGATGLGKLDKYGCSISGKYFPEGSKVPPTPNKPCEHCYCIRNMTTCVMQECTLHVDGCTPIYHKDVCCPVRYSCDHPEDEMPLLDDMSTTVRPTPGFLLTTTTISPVTQMTQDCVHDDQIFADGALIKTEKACEHCYCMKGDIVCVVQECGAPMENEGKNCTSLPPREGQCCPDTYICEGDELSSDVPTESTTESLVEKITTLLPPRRGGVEGSGYRNEPDESPYTEMSTIESELEGSGEEQETSKPLEPEEIIPEDVDQYISVSTKAPTLEESPQVTTEIDKHIIPDEFSEEKTAEPQVFISTTNAPIKEIEKLTTSEGIQEENLEPLQHVTLGSIDSHERFTTESGELLNTVPDVIPDEEIAKLHEHAFSTTNVPILEESGSPSPPEDEKIKPTSIEKLPESYKPEYSTPDFSSLDEIEKDTATSPEISNVTPGVPEKEYSETEEDRTRTTTPPKIGESEMPGSQVGEEEEEQSSKPEQYIPSTTSIPEEYDEKLTSEPDHAQNTVAVAEEETYPHLHIAGVTSDLPTVHESATTPSTLEQDFVTDTVVKHDVFTSTAAPALEEVEFTTAEPDKGLNTIPNEINEEASSEPSLVERTTVNVDAKTTESSITTDKMQIPDDNVKSTTVSETATLLPESIITKGDQYTITTEPSFRKEDESSFSTEKQKEFEQTTVKAEFVDEGFIPTSTHDEKLDTSSDIPSPDEEITTLVPEYTKEIDETIGSKQTTEAIIDTSIVTENVPGKSPEPSDQEGKLPSSTEKATDVTAIIPEDIETPEEPGRIPGEGDCLLNGITYKNNTIVPSSNNCHTGCRCASSIIKCDPIICSPPPDYMDNCQSIYDSPDSCCPTYVCDHPRETVPPQSDNQMSGTESPMPSPTIECRGDQCELSEPVKTPAEPETDQKPGIECGPYGCDVLQKPDSLMPSEEKNKECIDGKCKSEGCTGSSCQLPPTQGQVSPIKPCVGEHCEKVEGVSPPSPQLCDNKEDCNAQIPAIQATPCEGESCKAADCGADGCDSTVILKPQDTQQGPCNGQGDCQPQDTTIPDCTGDEPCRRKEIPKTEEKLPSKCEGSHCLQETETTVAQGVVNVSTESPLEEPTRTEKVTSTEYEKTTDLPGIIVPNPEDIDSVSVKDETDTYTTEDQSDIKISEEDIQKETPLVIKDEDFEKPSVIDEENKIESGVDEESTELPGVTEIEITEKPISAVEEQATAAVDKGITEKPISTSEETEKPTIASEEGKPTEGEEKLKPVIEEDKTEKPGIIEEESISEPALVDEVENEKPTDIEDKKPVVIDEEGTDKPGVIKDESTMTPSVIEEEGTVKPDLVDEANKETPTATEDMEIEKPIVTDEESKHKPPVDEEEGTGKPELIDDISKEKPTIDVEKPKEPAVSEEKEVTKKPVSLDKKDENKPIIITKEEEEKPAGTEEEGKEKPPVVDEESTEKTIVDEGSTEETYLLEEVGTKKPVLIDEEYKPAVIEEQDTDKPITEQESTEEPTIEEDKKKPAFVEKDSTEKPLLIDEEGEVKPAMVDKDTEKPVVIEEESMKLPTEPEEEKPEIPAIIEESTDKTAIVKDSSTITPAIVNEEVTELSEEIQEEGTEKPIVVKEDSSITPVVVDKEDKEELPVFEKDSTEKPVIEDDKDTRRKEKPVETEEVYDKPVGSDKDTTEKPVGNEGDEKMKPEVIYGEHVTEIPATIKEHEVKPALTDESETEKTMLVNEDSKEKPTVDEEMGLGTPVVVGDDNDQKPVLTEVERTEKPAITGDYDEKEPTVTEIESTKIPPISEKEGTETPTMIDEEDGEKPAVDEDVGTKKPVVDEDEGTKEPAILEEGTDKPEQEEGTEKPATIIQEDKEKPVVEDEESPETPAAVEGTKKPAIIEEEGTEKPSIVEEEDTIKPVVIEREGTPKPTVIEEEGSEKPAMIDEEKKEKIPVDEHDTEKPTTIEKDGTEIPALIEEKITEKPTMGELEGTEEPVVTGDDGIAKPTIDEEKDIKEPTQVEEGGTEGPLDKDENSEKPAIIDEELEKEGTKKPQSHEEEGSGSEIPEINVTEPEEASTEMPAVIDEESKKKPVIVDEEIPKEPTTDEESTQKPGIIEEEGTEKPAMIDEEVKEKPFTVKVEEATKPALTESYDTEKPITTGMEEESTKKPVITDEEGKEKPAVDEHEKPVVIKDETDMEVDDEGAVKPVADKEEGTEKPAVIDEEGEVKPAIDEEEDKKKITQIEEKSTEKPIVEKEIITDNIDSPTTEAPEVDSVPNELQEGVYLETPELPITSKPEEEIIKPVPESHVTETKTDQTIIPGYDSTTSLPKQTETPERASEVPDIIDSNKPKPESPESHSIEPEKMPTYLPEGVHEEKTDQPEVYSPEKEELITETPAHSVTERIKSFTETEDYYVTGQEDMVTGYPEHHVPSVTVKIDETDVSTQSSEKPLLTDIDIDTPESLEETSESTKPIMREPVDSTQTSDDEKEKPDTFEPHATASPVPTTETLDTSQDLEKDVSKYEEDITSVPDISDQTHKGTVPPEGYTEGQEASTVIPQHYITISEDYSKSTESYITEQQSTQEISTKSEQPEIPDTQKITTEIPKTSIREGESETKAPEVIYTDSELQKASTELPTPSEDVQTEMIGIKVTSDVPESLVTGHHDDLGQETTVSTKPKEESPQEPELLTTNFQEITKAPELTVHGQEEIQTETPIHMTESSEPGKPEPEITQQDDKKTKLPEEVVTEKQDTLTTLPETPKVPQEETKKPEDDSKMPEVTTSKQIEFTKSTEQTSAQSKFSETTPYSIELEEHTHKIVEEYTTLSTPEDHTYKIIEDISTLPAKDDHSYEIEKHPSTLLPFDEDHTTVRTEAGQEPQVHEQTTKTMADEGIETVTKEIETTSEPSRKSSPDGIGEKVSESSVPDEVTTPATISDVENKYTLDHKEYSTSTPSQVVSEESTPAVITETEKSPIPGLDIAVPIEKETPGTEKPLNTVVAHETSAPEDEFIFATTKATTVRQEEETLKPVSDDKVSKPDEKPDEASEAPAPSTTTEVLKPGVSDIQPTDEIPAPDEEGHFPPSGTSGYGEPDYVEEDQAFGPGTCRYGGKVYVSAQQIPRDDPCDFCFCFRSDIICLQQSCPPPIHGCHEEPIQGFCCPRYECPVSMATTVNVTTTTTTTTTTLPPHFPTHSYKGAAQRRGCQIKGHTYKVGEVVRSSSGPCLHCTCGGDGQMKCDPKACTPEPMLRQMIAAAVSAKRRR